MQAGLRREAKLAKRAAFDSKGRLGSEEGDDAAPGPRAGGKATNRPADEGPSYFESLKAELAARSSVTAQALANMTPAARVAMQGLCTGTYVRMRLSGGTFTISALSPGPCRLAGINGA